MLFLSESWIYIYIYIWVPDVFQPEHKVKTVEPAYGLNKNREECPTVSYYFQ